MTPTIRSASITFSDIRQTATLIPHRIKLLETRGKLEEAANLRAQWDALVASGAIQNHNAQLIPLLEKLKGLLEELVILKEKEK